ncbi:MAG TPA: glutamine synthetase family protein [Candidatus Aminicenantes bacterium]|nr:glutamine synthetase family protein [Candidatus Aminicenantes bacterium]
MDSSFTLANPVSLIVGKDKESFTREDLIKVIEARAIERITFHYTGLDGKIKELKIPVANRYQAERILADGERADGSSLFKGMVDSAVSDVYVVPLYHSAFLNPFDAGSLDLMCRYVTPEGNLAPFALDTILTNASDLFRKNTGLDLYALGELEFFLLSDPGDNLYPAEKQRGYHSSAPFMKSGEIVNEMVRLITQLTGTVKYAHGEVGYVDSVRSDIPEIMGKRAEQLEIEFLPTPIVETGDNLVLSRWIIRNVARKHGCVATFTPKIEEGIAGTGLHVHMELRREGRNIMRGDDGELSPEARKAIGGLCHYADSLTAFGNTVSSAYLRLVPNQEAPTRICWSDRNRSAMIRVPLGWTKQDNLAKLLNPQQVEGFQDPQGRQTFELRSPDGSAILHLLLAGITMAAEYGLTHPEESQALADKLYVVGNIFKNRELLDKLPALPKSCVESAQVLMRKRDLYERNGIFPASVIEYVAKLLMAEKDENMNQTLMDLPADDRLHETRKIMHKDLHRH